MRKDWYTEHKFSDQSEWNRRARALAWFFPCDFKTIIFSLCRGAASTWFLISFIILFSGWVMENWVWIMRGNAKHLQQPNDLEPQNSLSILFKQWISWETQWARQESYCYRGAYIIFKFVLLQIKSVPELLLISGVVYSVDFAKSCVYDTSLPKVPKWLNFRIHRSNL